MGRIEIHLLRFQKAVGVVPNYPNPTIPHYLYTLPLLHQLHPFKIDYLARFQADVTPSSEVFNVSG